MCFVILFDFKGNLIKYLVGFYHLSNEKNFKRIFPFIIKWKIYKNLIDLAVTVIQRRECFLVEYMKS